MKRRLLAAGCTLALATGGHAQQTISVGFRFELVGVFVGTPKEQAAFESSVAEDLAAGLDAHVGFLDFEAGAEGSHAHHLLVSLVPSAETKTGATFSSIKCRLSGQKEGETDPLTFVKPEVLVDYKQREDLETRIRAAFVGGDGWLPRNREHVVERLFSQIPIREQITVGYWAVGDRGFVPIPLFYSDLRAWHETVFRLKLRAASPFAAPVELDVPSVSYAERIAPFLSAFEASFAGLDGYPDDYWKGGGQREPVVCELEQVTDIPGLDEAALATEAGATGTLSAAEIFVVKYKHREWTLKKNVPGEKAGS